MAGAKKTTKQLETLYEHIMQFLKGANITLILFWGSLLGFYRDSNFIEGDDDIDVLVSRADFQSLNSFLIDNKHEGIRVKYIENYPDIVQLFYKDIGPFDIYAYDFHDDSILLKHDGNLLFKNQDIFPLQTIQFHSHTISIPVSTERVISLSYGKDWKIPQKKWSDYDPHKILQVDRLTPPTFIPHVNRMALQRKTVG